MYQPFRGGTKRALPLVAAGIAALTGATAAPAFADHPGATRLGPALELRDTRGADDPSTGGDFSAPFAEPTINGVRTDEQCLEREPDEDGRRFACKPTAGSVNVLAGGDAFYWDALEGTENIKASLVAEYGVVSQNDQSRRLDLTGAPRWSAPTPFDAGANPDGYDNGAILPPPLSTTETENDGALFCSDNNLLPDGRVLAAGGTAYYNEPGAVVAGQALGVAELEGLRNTRIYDPRSNTWSQTGSMERGRWYPTLVTLPSGNQFVASGVTKLVKPVYPGTPEDSLTNVRQTETFDLATGEWSNNGESAERSLPLFPRLHLLPNGDVFYNAAGQSFNPFGQSYDEPFWNIAASYDPESASWTNLGIPGLDSLPNLAEETGDPVGDVAGAGIPGGGKALTIPGFRGSTFSTMLTLRPNEAGEYDTAEFLTAGGVVNPPSPGSYFATSDSRIATVETDGDAERMSTRPTGDLDRPRWYPSNVLLPTGEVIAFSGADRDEVAVPGTEFPIKRAEMFDPESETWSALAEAHRPRTYHNTAVLLPSGKVLIGGHAPISTAYLKNQTLLPGLTAPNNGRDPSFEIYKPPYLFRGERPRITDASRRLERGGTTTIETAARAGEVESVVAVRNPSQTHVIDGDQRTIELPIARRSNRRVTVDVPESHSVLAPGPYMLFAIAEGDGGPVPSRAAQTFVELD